MQTHTCTHQVCLARKHDLFPVFDSAYQGLARGLNEDVAVVRKFLDAGLEFAVCSSCSKNFGLYGERVGSLFVACAAQDVAGRVASRCKMKIRTNYSVPPLFGAKIVVAILSDPALRGRWEQVCCHLCLCVFIHACCATPACIPTC